MRNTDRFSLIGVDGNAFSIMAYTQNALKKVGRPDLVPEMLKKAQGGDYNGLIMACQYYINLANLYDIMEEIEND